MTLAAALLVALPALVEAPLSLTTSDGTGLRLVTLDADAVCAGPVCFTELRLAFENPEDRVIEGQFQIALPPGASVSRFAMKIDQKWQEAEVVEKQAARRAYEDFLHRRQDPALLEQAAGNSFQARVFPIPARGRKELIVSYGHSIASSKAPYVLPLVGLPQVEKLKVRVRDADTRTLLTLDKARWVPNVDASVVVPGARAIRSEDVVVLRAAPSFASAADTGDGPVVVLVDTSASRALQLPKDVQLVSSVLKELAQAQPSRSVVVFAFDQTMEDVYRGPLSGFDASRLMKRRALGATDLAGALSRIGAGDAGSRVDRFLVVSDGVTTAELGASLDAAVGALRSRGVRRVDAIVRGGVRDESTLARIVRAGRDEGIVVDGDAGAAEIARRLRLMARSGLAVDVAGATWVWPKTLDSVQPGDERVIVAELPAKQAALTVKIGGVAVDLGGAAASAPTPLLRRAWAEAKIARAQASLLALPPTATKESRKEIKDQIVAISTKHRVLSSETALLVLETEEDYVRYGIDRKALADILVVNDGGIALTARKDAVVAVKKPPPPPAKPTTKTVEKRKARNGRDDGDDDGGAAADKKDGEYKESFNGDSDGTPDAKPAAELAADEAPADAPKIAEPEPEMRRLVMTPATSGAPAAEPPPSPSPRAPPPPPPPPGVTASPSTRDFAEAPSEEAVQEFVNPWTGPFDAGMKLLQAGKREDALRAARAWREEQPGDVLALFLLAEAYAAGGTAADVDEAARALGAIIDLFPSRTDLRRAVGARLDKLAWNATKSGAKPSSTPGALSIDTWRKSVEQRADHPQSHRGLAWALVRAGRYADAFAAIEVALQQRYRDGSFRGVDRILREDLGLIATAWKAHGGGAKEIDARLKKAGGVTSEGASLRFVLWWETDSNDVDFHIRDGKRNHAYYSTPTLPTGGTLYADVTTGYGPECFTIDGAAAKRAYPYALSAHYYSRGPMGFGLGTLLVVDHDGKGNFTFSDRPFVIMVDGAFVDLGTVANR